MAIAKMKAKQGSNHKEVQALVKSLARQLGPKKQSANTRLQGALVQKASSFFTDKDAVNQTERQNGVRISIVGSELTVTSKS